MVSLFRDLPAGVLAGLAVIAGIGIFLVLWKEPLSALIRWWRTAPGGSGTLSRLLLYATWLCWKGISIPFYIFLFGFPLVFLFLVALPTIRLTRENELTAQDLLVYGQRRDAVALVVPPIDRRLSLASAEQVKADADKLHSIFRDEKDWGRVLSWARLLADEKYLATPRRLTDDEAAHVAWQHLSRFPGTKEQELLRLEEVIAQAVPEEEQRRRLLEWGRARNHWIDKEADLLLFTRLPRQDWFAWWTVYTEYCPTADGLAARKEFLTERLGGDRFGRDLWKALLDWGKESYENQPALAELLPAGERAYTVAAVDRMVGLDEAGRKVYQLDNANQVPLGKDYGVLFLLLHVFYPNDDLTYMVFGSGWGGEHSLFATGVGGPSAALLVVGLYLVLWALLVQRSLRRLTIHYLGRAMRLGDNPALARLAHAAFNPWLQVLSLLVVIPVTWLFARWFMEGFYVLYFRSEITLVLAVLYSALIGGALCEAIQNMLAVACIRFGLDPERLFVDNVVAGGVSAAVLWYYQNSWFSIASGLALGLFTSLVLNLIGSKGRAAERSAGKGEGAPKPRRREIEEKPSPPAVRRPVSRRTGSDLPSTRPTKQAPPSGEKQRPPPARRKRPPQDEVTD